MRAMLDLNVVLDVVQLRHPHYQDSAQVLSRARLGELEAVLPSHAITTLHYLLAKTAGKGKADQTVDWLLANFAIAEATAPIFRRARELPLSDFEDAVVVSMAEMSACQYIVTRNIDDFAGAPVPAIAPRDFLVLLPSAQPPPPSPV